jgi:tetratricopeptide (TPR) repeat protein
MADKGDLAVKRSTAMLRWFPNSAHFTFLRGTALLFAGRPEEAESELRASLTKGSGLAQSSRLVNLGYIQLDKVQFQEAIVSFQRAAAIFDRSGTACGAMTDARLRGGAGARLGAGSARPRDQAAHRQSPVCEDGSAYVGLYVGGLGLGAGSGSADRGSAERYREGARSSRHWVRARRSPWSLPMVPLSPGCKS